MTVPADSPVAKCFDVNNTKAVSHKLLNEFSEIIGDGKVTKFFEYTPETGAVKEIPSAIAGIPVIFPLTPKEKIKEVDSDNQKFIPAAVPKYDFTGEKFLVIEKYTLYPLSQKPNNPLGAKIWLAKKKAADQLIKDAWDKRNN